MVLLNDVIAVTDYTQIQEYSSKTTFILPKSVLSSTT